MEQLAILNPEGATDAEVSQYTIRKAARAIVVDSDNNVGLLEVGGGSYYKLPGGGVEDGEDIETALRRECREEIGCEVDILHEVGAVIEYRKIFSVHQISDCYFANVRGTKGETAFTAEELAEGFKVLWVPYEEAVCLADSVTTSSPEMKLYVAPRLKILLEAAARYCV